MLEHSTEPREPTDLKWRPPSIEIKASEFLATFDALADLEKDSPTGVPRGAWLVLAKSRGVPADKVEHAIRHLEQLGHVELMAEGTSFETISRPAYGPPQGDR